MATSDEDCFRPSHAEENDIKKIFEKCGLSGIKSQINQWKNVPLNVAITGNSGTGKSSFINAIRGLTADDEGAAAVGVVETTIEPTPYSDPKNKNLIFWDLPGVGTLTFKKDIYLKKVEFSKYDFFLIFCSTRFTENDIWLAQAVQAQDKKYYFIRTSINDDIENHEESIKGEMANAEAHSREYVLQTIRDNFEENFEGTGMTTDNLFLIDNYSTHDYDFDKLCVRLIEDAPALKKEAMVLSISMLTKEVIESKRKVLQNRIWKVAALSGIAGAIPIPGIGEGVDVFIILEEAIFYRNQLGLSDEILQREAQQLKMNFNAFKTGLNLASSAITFSTKGIARHCISLGASAAVENLAKFGIPVLGSVVAAGVSYSVTVACLRDLLNTMVIDARKINEKMIIELVKPHSEALA